MTVSALAALTLAVLPLRVAPASLEKDEGGSLASLCPPVPADALYLTCFEVKEATLGIFLLSFFWILTSLRVSILDHSNKRDKCH